MKKLAFFDGHNDVLLRLLNEIEDQPANSFVTGNRRTQIDLPRAREAGFAGGFFAAFAPSPERFDLEEYQSEDGYSVPMPPPLPIEKAQKATLEMFDLLEDIETLSAGQVRVCKSFAELQDAHSKNQIAAIMHIEGADCIDAKFKMLDTLYQRGLRSIGLVWSRNNIFGYGVPFQFPAPPDIGPGLTEIGKELVSECNRKKVLIDLSHLNQQGFWDVASISNAPLVATHSNAHRLCPSPRNLTDDQLRAIAGSGGVVGVNFAPCFLAQNGILSSSVPLETVLLHVNYLVQTVGEDCVALGSDFDGVMMPEEIRDVTGVPKIFAALEKHGMKPSTIEKIALKNWMRVLRQTIG
ncbi:MAG: dipeptidase [Roseibium sp.]|uniref:dipeptidase n=1 Tax=Roseibium sp. TaxID=1936156 RepID=UPI002608272E|nr:dipeptidase [Roseibium sp.]MCV0429334.1 dipeptidase [Roseibium sp.]